MDKPGQLFEDAQEIHERLRASSGAASSEDRSYILDDGLEGLTRSFHEDDQLRIAKWRRRTGGLQALPPQGLWGELLSFRHEAG